MKWNEYEELVVDCCEEAVGRCNDAGLVDVPRWMMTKQQGGWYADGYRRIDVLLSERRRGGISILVDAKHYVASPAIPKHIIIKLDRDRQIRRASHSILIASPDSYVPESIIEELEENYPLTIITRETFDFVNDEEQLVRFLTSSMIAISRNGPNSL